jgi:hypothetical protein
VIDKDIIRVVFVFTDCNGDGVAVPFMGPAFAPGTSGSETGELSHNVGVVLVLDVDFGVVISECVLKVLKALGNVAVEIGVHRGLA